MLSGPEIRARSRPDRSPLRRTLRRLGAVPRRKRDRSPWFHSLNGDWRFRLCERPEHTPSDFFEPGVSDRDWSRIEVPGHWTLQGFDRPHYTNVQMPFPEPPPQVPEANPTGLYRRRFTLPPGWTASMNPPIEL